MKAEKVSPNKFVYIANRNARPICWMSGILRGIWTVNNQAPGITYFYTAFSYGIAYLRAYLCVN